MHINPVEFKENFFYGFHKLSIKIVLALKIDFTLKSQSKIDFPLKVRGNLFEKRLHASVQVYFRINVCIIPYGIS